MNTDNKTVKPIAFSEMSERQQQPFIDIARFWGAWRVGTMDENDFIKADSDDNLIIERAEMIYTFMQETSLPSN